MREEEAWQFVFLFFSIRGACFFFFLCVFVWHLSGVHQELQMNGEHMINIVSSRGEALPECEVRSLGVAVLF